MEHGTRTAYQRDHCRCLPCRAANTAYQARYRGKVARGEPLPRAIVSARPALALLTAFRREWLSQYGCVASWDVAISGCAFDAPGSRGPSWPGSNDSARYYEIGMV
jgi:hypothetical protein